MNRRANLNLDETRLPQMIKEVVKESDIDPLLGHIGRCECRCLRGKHNYAESAVNRNLGGQKEPIPAAISVRVQHGPIDIGIAAANNEFLGG